MKTAPARFQFQLKGLFAAVSWVCLLLGALAARSTIGVAIFFVLILTFARGWSFYPRALLLAATLATVVAGFALGAWMAATIVAIFMLALIEGPFDDR